MDPSSEILPSNSPSESTSVAPELPTPDSGPIKPEKVPATLSPEVGASRLNQIAQPDQTTVPPLSLPPVVSQTVAADNPSVNIVGSAPVIADDVDVIEKEWVDKAKQIVDQTKSDPYSQEQAVEQLQRSYLKKRYNKDLKSPNS